MKFLKGLLWIVSYPFVGIYLVVQFILTLIMSSKYKKDSERYTVEERYKRVMSLIDPLLYLKNIKVEVNGKEKINSKSMLYVGNHKSNGDPLFLLKAIYKSSTNNVSFVAKQELQKSILSPIFRLLDVIYIDRNNLRQIASTIEEQNKLLKDNGRGLVIFPEGTRDFSNNMLEFKAGALTSAYNTLSTIQPFVIINSAGSFDSKDSNGNRFKRNYLIPKTVTISFLKPINPFDFKNVNKEIISKQIQESVFKKYQELNQKK